MKPFGTVEEYYINRCLALAERGRGTTSPNPMVGAVVLDAQGRKVGEGFHQKAGGPHAEVVALSEAGEAARGGTLYVNLEPCNHTGKTPPCTEQIIQAGIERVICGTLDPNPRVSGSGRDKLQNSRISVRHGFLETECQKLNEIFFHAIRTHRPFVTLKLACTLDGKIADRAGQSQWITGPLARQYVHHLRAGYDAILTTAQTVMADNPQLTVRDVPVKTHQPIRVILDRRFRLNPDDYKIFQSQSTTPTWVFTSRLGHDQDHAFVARQRGIEVIEVDDTGLGLNLEDVFRVLGERKINSVFVEAGGRLAGSLISENRVNKLYMFMAPKLLHDAMALPALSGAINLALPNAPALTITHTQTLEGDWVIEAYPGTPPWRQPLCIVPALEA